MRSHAVIGMNFGDEGKGLMTDYLVHKFGGTVVRVNGSAQAGHTVVTPEGKRHVFHHFGSGTFLGAPTHLSLYFMVHPMLFRPERDVLTKEFGLKPVVSCSPVAQIITPYDMALNQLIADKSQHGSVGMGVHECWLRQRTLPFCVNDLETDLLYGMSLFESRMSTHAEFALWRAAAMGVNLIDHPVMQNEDVVARFKEDCKFFVENLSKFSPTEHYVFEGAQGLQLDPRYGVMPYCTPSDCGMRNVAYVADSLGVSVEAVYVTRSYVTRHGNGPLDHEWTEYGTCFEDKTNLDHVYQGPLRFGELRGHYFETAQKDFANFSRYGDIQRFAVTHLDQHDSGAHHRHTPKYFANGETRLNVSEERHYATD